MTYSRHRPYRRAGFCPSPPLPSSPPRPRRCPICNHAHVAPRCRHSVSCAADIIARPDARRRRRRGCSRVFSPANDIMIIHRGKKGIRGSVQASSVTRKREMSLLVSNSLSFFLSFEEDILDLENLRSVVPCRSWAGREER